MRGLGKEMDTLPVIFLRCFLPGITPLCAASPAEKLRFFFSEYKRIFRQRDVRGEKISKSLSENRRIHILQRSEGEDHGIDGLYVSSGYFLLNGFDHRFG